MADDAPRLCKTCSAPLRPAKFRTRPNRYCGVKCYPSRLAKLGAKNPAPRPCPRCRTPFVAKGARKYCSKTCGQQVNTAAGAMPVGPGRLLLTCSQCGDPFPTVRARPAGSNPVCSKKCRSAMERARGQAECGAPRAGANPATSERGYTDEQTAFLMAVDRYRREAKRLFPTATEILAIAISLGYRKVAEPGPLPGCKATEGESSNG